MNTAVRERLTQAARAGQFVFTGELAEMLGLDLGDRVHQLELVRVLDEIDRAELAEGRPMLSAIAVRPEDHLPGPELALLGRELGVLHEGEDEAAFAQRQIRMVHETWREVPRYGEAEETV